METKRDGTFYSDLDIAFSLEEAELHALKISLECFHRIIPEHSHSDNSWEIHYIPSGRGRVTLSGTEYTITPNTLYITGPHVEHAQIPDEDDPMSEYCVYLKFSDRASQPGKTPSLLKVFRETPYWFGPDTQNIHAVMQNLFMELKNRYTGYMIQVRALLQQLLILIVRNYEAGKLSTAHFELSNLMDSNYLIIEESFLYEYNELTLGKLAAKLGLSTRQTERLLSRHYGRTFLQKKTEAKMSMAAILLRDKKMSVTEASEALSYSSVEHFSAAFRRYYGVSASEYRKIPVNEITKKPGC